MAAKGRGGGKTPNRVMELLRGEVIRTSQAATARATGIALQSVQNYIKGIGEPSQANLEKLSDYFMVTVPWLRGENIPTDYNWSSKMLETSEVLFTIALSSDISFGDEEKNKFVRCAQIILNVSDELKEQSNPDHLFEVQSMAQKVLNKFNEQNTE